MSALCKIERCIGCSSCASICQRNAISMVPDDSGFLFPKIEKALCVDCKLCERVCPVPHQPAVSVHTEMRKEKCSKLQNWIVSCGARWKQNGWIEAGLFIFLLYAIHFCVYLNGDDFMYATFGKQGILENVWNYYHTGNGRFWINILDSALLVFDRYLFIFLNPLLILAFLYLLAKNVQTILGEKIEPKCLVFTGGVLLSTVDVLCLRETVFWITGMMNYLFPATLFLLATLMFQYSKIGRLHGKQWPLYWVSCLLAGSSVEQYALMFVGVMTLILGTDLLHKRKFPYQCWIGYTISIVGVLVLILAPGNFERVGEQSEYFFSFIDNAWTLFWQNTFSDVSFPFILMLSLCATIIDGNSVKSTVSDRWLRLTPSVILLIKVVPAFEKAILFVIVTLSFLLQMTKLFVLRQYPYKAFSLSLTLVGFGSQIMLLISHVWGFRCMFSMYLIFMLLIMLCLQEVDGKTKLFILCSGVAASLHPLLVVVYWCILLLAHSLQKESAGAITTKVLLHSCVFAALAILLIGYAGNVETHRQNLESTHNPEASVVTLKELPDDTYSWYFVPFGEFHENYYRKLHQIQENVAIEYSTLDSTK